MTTRSKPMTDTDKLLEVLQLWPGWNRHTDLLDIFYTRYHHGCTIHSRVSDIRKKGYDVECKVERKNGRAISWYRLVT